MDRELGKWRISLQCACCQSGHSFEGCLDLRLGGSRVWAGWGFLLDCLDFVACQETPIKTDSESWLSFESGSGALLAKRARESSSPIAALMLSMAA